MTGALAATAKIVVVGAGIAGVRAVEGLRAGGHDGPLTLVDADPEQPYDRPPLSKEFLTGEFDEDDVRLWTADRVAELEIELLLGTTATGLDTGRRVLAVSAGSTGHDELHYDRLVLATGLTPRRPAALTGLDGVHVLRSLADARALRKDLRAGRPQVVVVGGGFIGTEVAAAAATLGLDVTIVEGGGHLMPDALHRDLVRPVERLHRERGVTVVCGQTVAGIRGAGRPGCVELDDGTRLPADVVVVGVGGVPCTGWLAASGLQLEDGVRTDAHLRTAAPDVYAVGDVARRPGGGGGPSVRVEHWTNAVRQGTHVARAVLGAPDPYRDVPYVWSDQHHARLQIAGAPDGDEIHFLDGGPDEPAYLALIRRGTRLAGVVALDRQREFTRFRRTLADAPVWDSVLAAATPVASVPSPFPSSSPESS